MAELGRQIAEEEKKVQDLQRWTSNWFRARSSMLWKSLGESRDTISPQKPQKDSESFG